LKKKKQKKASFDNKLNKKKILNLVFT